MQQFMWQPNISPVAKSSYAGIKWMQVFDPDAIGHKGQAGWLEQRLVLSCLSTA